MTGLKGAYRKVCKLFVDNGAFAPGTWTEPQTFGDPADHYRNIEDFGFFIFSLPVSEQSSEVRATRAAPSTQIAAKTSGAIHTSSVIAFVS